MLSVLHSIPEFVRIVYQERLILSSAWMPMSEVLDDCG